MPKSFPKHGQLTKFLIDQGVLKDDALIKAFDSVDRRDFLPDSQRPLYLANRPLPIGFEQTNSQPFTVAFMLELLLPEKTDKILDLGSGSGWTTALIAATGAQVTGVERIPGLVTISKANLSAYNFPNAKIVQADNELGYPREAPYTKILVSAGIDHLPQTLVDQLEEGGRLIIPINQGIHLIEKTSQGLKTTVFDGFIFVPLVTEDSDPV